MKYLKHILIVIAALLVFLGIPAWMHVDIPSLFAGSKADVVSSASMEVPDQPSGQFLVLMKTELHADTIQQWELFFAGEDAGVIMSDVNCMVIDTDAAGIKLAERCMIRLPENQMQMKKENGLLLASKAEEELFDTIIVSKEFADVYGLGEISARQGVTSVFVNGE